MQNRDVTAVVFNTKVSEKEELFKLKDNVKTKANEDKLSTDQFRGEIRRSVKGRKWMFWNRFSEKQPRTDPGHLSHGAQCWKGRCVLLLVTGGTGPCGLVGPFFLTVGKTMCRRLKSPFD